MRWFLIQIAYNIGSVVKTDKCVRTNGARLMVGVAGRLTHSVRISDQGRDSPYVATASSSVTARATSTTWCVLLQIPG